MSVFSVELLCTGTELLLGSVSDTHLAWFGREIFPYGLRISRQTTVPDGAAIRDALLESFGRTDVLIVTGGLGPTTDDITRELVAEILGRRLILHQETLARIEERCRKRGFVFQHRMERQALVPEGATVLPNENGSAPGLSIPPVEGVSWRSPHLFLLPGPPRELQPMASEHVLPFLKDLSSSSVKPDCRIYRVVGMGESTVEEKVGLELTKRCDIEVGYCARPNEVDLRLIGTTKVLDEVEPLVLTLLGDCLLSKTGESMEESVVSMLKMRGATVATAESCTGGALANRLTNVPGASAVFLEGFVTYSNQSKTELLGVPTDLILRHGAVSAEVAVAMAEGARVISAASYALSLTGIAGPDGGGADKQLGTLWIALAATGKETQMWKNILPTDRLTFKQLATQTALEYLRRRMLTGS